MQTRLETLGPLKRRLDLLLPQNEIETEVENRLKRLTRTVKLHGFRPGKVPYKLVAQQYGPQVRQEVLGETLQKGFAQAVREQNLRVAGFPRFEVKAASPASAQVEASATFEVYPEVVLGDLSAVAIERPVLEVGPEHVDKTIAILRKQRAVFEPVDRPAAPGDRVVIDYRGSLEGQELSGATARDLRVVLGEGRLLPDFEARIVGLGQGQSKAFELTFPADYHDQQVAGKTVAFELTVKGVEATKLPEVDAEFAKSLGVEDGDLAKMRAEVKANLEREVKRRIQTRIKEQVMQALLAQVQLDLPRALVEAEIQRLAHAARHDLEARGIRVGSASLPPEAFEEQAQRRVKLGLILAELVAAHKLHAKPEQVRSMVEDFAQSYERPEEVVKWYYAEPQRLSDVEALVLEENVVSWVLGNARVVEKRIAFEDLMG